MQRTAVSRVRIIEFAERGSERDALQRSCCSAKVMNVGRTCCFLLLIYVVVCIILHGARMRARQTAPGRMCKHAERRFSAEQLFVSGSPNKKLSLSRPGYHLAPFVPRSRFFKWHFSVGSSICKWEFHGEHSPALYAALSANEVMLVSTPLKFIQQRWTRAHKKLLIMFKSGITRGHTRKFSCGLVIFSFKMAITLYFFTSPCFVKNIRKLYLMKVFVANYLQ